MQADQDGQNLSIVLITLNEAERLPACLRSLPRGAEVVVLDSGSQDRTVEIARQHGARVELRPFTNHAEQKNAALGLATRPWVFSVDADEVLTEALRAELVRATSTAALAEGQPTGYRVDRRLVFMGRVMRFGKSSDRPLRLFRREVGRFESEIHEHVVLSRGRVGRLRGGLLHYSYDDLTDYFGRFNAYTTQVAANHARLGHRMPPLAAHVLRPWAEFVSRYCLRLGFLDGYPGYTYALLSSFYTYVKYAKLKERLTAGRVAP